MAESAESVRVGFRYQDGEVLSPERESLSEDVELPVAVIDLGDGEWLTLAELRDIHGERLEQTLAAWEGGEDDPPARPDAAVAAGGEVDG